MSYDKNRNYQNGMIHLPSDAAEIYYLWAKKKRAHTGIHHISEFFIELLEKDMHDMRIEKDYAVSAYPHVKGQIQKKQAECLDIINKKWGLKEISEDVLDRIQIPLSEIHSIIEKIFGYTNEKTINREKKKLFKILEMQQIRKGNNWFMVSKFYSDPDEKLRKYYDEKETLQNRYEQLVGIIKAERGLDPHEIKSYIAGDNKLKEMINNSDVLFYSEFENRILHISHKTDAHRLEAAKHMANIAREVAR